MEYKRCLLCTWTPKKGRVAEPGFSGQAPGSGVIWQQQHKHHHVLLLESIPQKHTQKAQEWQHLSHYEASANGFQHVSVICAQSFFLVLDLNDNNKTIVKRNLPWSHQSQFATTYQILDNEHHRPHHNTTCCSPQWETPCHRKLLNNNTSITSNGHGA